MKILGIDPGIGRTGWGIVRVESGPASSAGRKLKVESFGCIETEVNSPVPGRLQAIYEEVQRIMEEYQPDEFAIEELFFNTNAKTAFVVGQARGVMLLAASQANLPIAIYTPLQVKIALTGYGRAEKDQVGQMVKTVLGLDKIPKPDDTADALAIALTHAFSYKLSKNR
jgi:crossover junction endodeoxyribonuclease RuvC